MPHSHKATVLVCSLPPSAHHCWMVWVFSVTNVWASVAEAVAIEKMFEVCIVSISLNVSAEAVANCLINLMIAFFRELTTIFCEFPVKLALQGIEPSAIACWQALRSKAST